MSDLEDNSRLSAEEYVDLLSDEDRQAKAILSSLRQFSEEGYMAAFHFFEDEGITGVLIDEFLVSEFQGSMVQFVNNVKQEGWKPQHWNKSE